MTPSQFATLSLLFTSGFKPVVWGSDKAGWRIGPHLVATRAKNSLERQGWIQSESSRIDEGATVDRLVWGRVPGSGVAGRRRRGGWSSAILR